MQLKIIFTFFIMITMCGDNIVNASDKNTDHINTELLDKNTVRVKFSFSRNNAGCGIIKYANCYEVEVVDISNQILYGKLLRLYVICPEILNGILHKKYYNIKITNDMTSLEKTVNMSCSNNLKNQNIREALLLNIE